jgi:hypothetical protein
VFTCCRSIVPDEDEADNGFISDGAQRDERWWYKPTQVCRRWRYLILVSASYLGLSLVCTYGTPVAEMLAHSPPLPLIIDLVNRAHDDGAEDEKEKRVILAFRHRDRLRRIRLVMPISKLQMFIWALDGEFPMLEALCIDPLTCLNTGLILPETLNAPHLRHLALSIDSYSNVRPNDLLQWLSRLPQLETLVITFRTYSANHELGDLLHEPIVIHITLPHLRWFEFPGNRAYLEALLPRITTPVLEKLQIFSSNEPIFSFPLLQQFVNATQDLSFKSVRVMFHERTVSVTMYPRDGIRTYPLHIQVGNGRFAWQVASAAQVLSNFGTVFSIVDHIILEYGQGVKWSARHGELDRMLWHNLLRTFSHVKTLCVGYHLGVDLSRALQVDEGKDESPIVLLPQLKELLYLASGDTRDQFDQFILARRNAGCPVTLVRIEHMSLCESHEPRCATRADRE